MLLQVRCDQSCGRPGSKEIRVVDELRYMVVIEQADDGSFSVYVPDLPGCVSSGDTREEALQMIREAIRGHLDVLRDHGDEVPLPRSTATTVDAA